MGFDVKISVIVPVYNSEEYLRRCIDSILKQSYELFELIAVDDGSSDNSWKILENYSKQYNRIRIIHQENAGPGKARNRGLDAASGEYVVFVDSDDFIENDYFLKLSKKTEDVIFIDVNQVDESFELICTEYMSDKREISKDEFIRSQMTGKINWGGVRKAVKRELLEKHNIRYSDHKIGEEAIFSFFIMYYAASFSFIEGPVYTYINRKGSQSDFKMDDPWGNVAELLKKQIENIGKYSFYADTLNAFFVTAEVVALDRLAQNYCLSQYLPRSRAMMKLYSDRIDKSYKVDYKNMPVKARLVNFFVKHEMSITLFVASKAKNKLKK